jgi:hypothetical protein
MDRTRLPSHHRFDPIGTSALRRIRREEHVLDAVAVHFSRVSVPMYTHEKATLSVVAKSIARLDGHRFVGEFDPKANAASRLLFVPSDTLMLDEARELGIHSSRQLYGAVVPYAFVKTKAITHRLIGTHSAQPSGWSSAFAQNVRSATLPGYTAFCAKDARLAAARLLALGPLRLKEPLGDGGHGQTTVGSMAALEAYLETIPAEKLSSHGLVLETNLLHVITRVWAPRPSEIGRSPIMAHSGRLQTITDSRSTGARNSSVFGAAGQHLKLFPWKPSRGSP